MTSRYTVNFSGNEIDIDVTTKASHIDDWLRQIRSIYNGHQRIIVGLDCEWRPNTVRGVVNRVATMQLCIDTKCLIIQLIHLDYFPHSLKSFCRDLNVTFVGAEVEHDAIKLWSDYGLDCVNHVDIQAMAMQRYEYYQKPSLKTLARQLTGMDMEKPSWVCRSDWEASVLSNQQVKYAAIDAYASYRVGNRLLNGY